MPESANSLTTLVFLFRLASCFQRSTPFARIYRLALNAWFPPLYYTVLCGISRLAYSVDDGSLIDPRTRPLAARRYSLHRMCHFHPFNTASLTLFTLVRETRNFWLCLRPLRVSLESTHSGFHCGRDKQLFPNDFDSGV